MIMTCGLFIGVFVVNYRLTLTLASAVNVVENNNRAECLLSRQALAPSFDSLLLDFRFFTAMDNGGNLSGLGVPT